MDPLMIAGVVSIGLVVGAIVGWYVNETPMKLASANGAIYLLSGTGVVGIFSFLSPSGATREYWFYPIGIFVGFFAAPYLDVHYNRLYDRKKSLRR